MVNLLLAVIYVAFISLGLPDSLLGAAWPAMQPALGVPLDSAGVLSMIVAGGTVVASLSADRMLHRFGTGRVTLVSVTMTACALLGYALAPGFWWLALAAVPMGLGAGAVDAGLNNFVALHYEARHMSWLHCFWGVGATVPGREAWLARRLRRGVCHPVLSGGGAGRHAAHVGQI